MSEYEYTQLGYRMDILCEAMQAMVEWNKTAYWKINRVVDAQLRWCEDRYQESVNECNDRWQLIMREYNQMKGEKNNPLTLSRSVMCSNCHKSAEDENGRIIVRAPECNDKDCSRAHEGSHWHMTYATILCKNCNELM